MPYSNDTGLPSVTDILRPYVDATWFTPLAAERGTRVHAAIENHLRGEFVVPLPADWSGYFDSFRRWADAVQPEVVLIEERLIHPRLRYCGKIDLVARTGGADVVIDWKTSEAVPRAAIVQAAAYRELYDAQGCRSNDAAVVRLRSDGSRPLVEYVGRDQGTAFNVFQGLINAYYYFGIERGKRNGD
jgi:hypothetical protein